MRKILLLAAAISFVPAAVSGMSSMGTGNYNNSRVGNGYQDNVPDREDIVIALKLIQEQQYPDAITRLQRALRVNEGNAELLNLLGFTSRMVGDYPASLDYYQRALARKPGHKGAHEYLGELYLAMHQPDQARAQLDVLAQLCPDGCAEKDALAQAITAYDVAAKTPAAGTAPAVTSATQQPQPSTPAPAITSQAQQPQQSTPPNPQ